MPAELASPCHTIAENVEVLTGCDRRGHHVRRFRLLSCNATVDATVDSPAAPTESLKAYEKAVELQRRKLRQAAARGGVSVAGVAEVIQTRVPAKLLNNAAVLYMRVGRPHKALELLEEALQVRTDAEMLTVRMLPCPASHDACDVVAALIS